MSTAIGGKTITEDVEGRERYPVNVRYARDFRYDPERPGARAGRDARRRPDPPAQVRHGLAVRGAADDPRRERQARRLRLRRHRPTHRRLRGRRPGGRRAGRSSRPGPRLVWAGQFNYLERAKARLRWVVPLTLGS